MSYVLCPMSYVVLMKTWTVIKPQACVTDGLTKWLGVKQGHPVPPPPHTHTVSCQRVSPGVLNVLLFISYSYPFLSVSIEQAHFENVLRCLKKNKSNFNNMYFMCIYVFSTFSLLSLHHVHYNLQITVALQRHTTSHVSELNNNVVFYFFMI